MFCVLFDLLISPVLPNFMKFSIRSQVENVFMYAKFLSQSIQGFRCFITPKIAISHRLAASALQ